MAQLEPFQIAEGRDRVLVDEVQLREDIIRRGA